jgi:glycosyltransferase involved in cell wall biosynthesis
MTTYNYGQYIKDAINSVLGQSYPHWRLFIIDDGSIDNTKEVVEEFLVDPRINYELIPHQGQTSALNYGMSLVSNPYFGWLDSDDILHPEALTETICMISDDAGVVYTNYDEIDENGVNLGLGRRSTIKYSKDRLLLDFMSFAFRLISTKLYHLVGGINVQYCRVQDYDLCLKLSEITNFIHIPKSLYYYRRHGKNMSIKNATETTENSISVINAALIRRGNKFVCEQTNAGKVKIRLRLSE